MKKSIKVFAVLMVILMAAAVLSGCGNGKGGKSEPEGMPGDVQTVADRSIGLAAKYAKMLDGDWGDQHAALVESGDGESSDSYDVMKAILDGFRIECGAYYIYAMYPSGSINNAPFFITVDGSEEIDDYGTEFEWEVQFMEAWNRDSDKWNGMKE